MYLVETRNPMVPFQGLQRDVTRFQMGGLPSPFQAQHELSGLNIGKFFSRVFHWEGIKKKLPRIGAGMASGLLMGGTGGGFWGAAASVGAGGIAAAIPNRRAGTSLAQDLLRGAGYGAIGGSIVGVGKSYFNVEGNKGVAGWLADQAKARWFGAQQAKQLKSVQTQAGATQGRILTAGGQQPVARTAYPKPIGPTPNGSKPQTFLLDTPAEKGFTWFNPTTWDWGTITKAIVPVTALGVSVMEQSAAEQNAKAAQAQADALATEAAILSTMPTQEQLYMPGFMGPAGPVYGEDLTSVPMDMGMMAAGGGGGGAPLLPGFGDMPGLFPGGKKGLAGMLPVVLPMIVVGTLGYFVFKYFFGKAAVKKAAVAVKTNPYRRRRR